MGDELSGEKSAFVRRCLSTVDEEPTLGVRAVARMRVNPQTTVYRLAWAETLVVNILNLCVSVTCHIWTHFNGNGKFM